MSGNICEDVAAFVLNANGLYYMIICTYYQILILSFLVYDYLIVNKI